MTNVNQIKQKTPPPFWRIERGTPLTHAEWDESRLLKEDPEILFFTKEWSATLKRLKPVFWKSVLGMLREANDLPQYTRELIYQMIMLPPGPNGAPMVADFEEILSKRSQAFRDQYAEAVRTMHARMRAGDSLQAKREAGRISAAFAADCRSSQERLDLIAQFAEKADAVAPLKILHFGNRDVHTYLAGKSAAENQKEWAAFCHNARNILEHDPEIATKDLRMQTAVNLLMAYITLLRGFPGTQEDPAYQVEWIRIKRCCDRLEAEPMELKDFKRSMLPLLPKNGHSSYIDQVAQQAYFRENLDVKTNILYLASREEFRQELILHTEHAVANLRRELAENSTVQNPVKEDELPPIAMAAGPVRSLVGFRGGIPAQNQVEELLVRSVVMATPNVWLSKAGVRFINGAIRPLMQQIKRRMAMDACTRKLIHNGYEAEHRKPVEQQEDRFRWAYNVRTRMEAQGELNYLKQKVGGPTSAEETILELAKQHPDLRFCIITTRQDLGLMIALAKNCANVVPLVVGEGPEGIRVQILMQPAIVGKMITAAVTCETTFADAAPVPPSAPERKQPESRTDTGMPPFKQVSKLSGEGSTVYHSSGEPVRLTQILGSGGEAIVCSTDLPGIAAKIYQKDHAGKIVADRSRYEKLCVMVSHPIGDDHFCWPQDLLFDADGCFVGFTMPQLPENTVTFKSSIMKLCNENVRQNAMRNWTREAVARLAAEVCRVAAQLPENILIGDVNPNNMVLDIRTVPTQTQKARFWIVDCDSFQVDSWRCNVGTTEFASPRIVRSFGSKTPVFSEIDRIQADDNYAMATLVFKMLMLNEVPYLPVNGSYGLAAIREQNFAYRVTDKDGTVISSGKNTPDGPFRVIWSNITKELRDRFVRSFVPGDEGAPAISDWIAPLEDYAEKLHSGWIENKLVQDHYFDPRHEWTEDLACEMCGKTFNIQRTTRDARKAAHEPILCSGCWNMYRNQGLYEKEYSVLCDCCGTEMAMDLPTAWAADAGYKKFYCAKCQRMENVRCECGNTFRLPHYEVARQEPPYRCDDCKQVEQLSCAKCGKPTYKQKYKRIELERKGRPMLCKDCMPKPGSGKRS